MKKVAVIVAIASALGALLLASQQPKRIRPITRLKATVSNVDGALAVSIPISFQEGILGEYFDEEDPGTWSSVVARRIEPSIDYSWPNGVPDGTSVEPDGTYSCRWTGFVFAATAGSWTFITTSDDGVRLWLDGALLFENWTIHSPTENAATRTLTAGWHPIKMELFNRWSQWGIQATAKLEFQGPGQPRAAISGANLCLDPTASARPVTILDPSNPNRTYQIKAVLLRRP